MLGNVDLDTECCISIQKQIRMESQLAAARTEHEAIQHLPEKVVRWVVHDCHARDLRDP